MILNLTQHAATDAQKEAGVVDLPPAVASMVRELLTVETLPTLAEVEQRCVSIVILINTCVESEFDSVMLGGASWMTSPLEHYLFRTGIPAVYSFSKRQSVETVQADGSVLKTNVFQHAGFIPAFGSPPVGVDEAWLP